MKEDKVTCIYCGKPTESQKFIFNPKAKDKLFCCSAQCFNDAQKFLHWDVRHRTPAYLILALCVIFNLFSFGFMWTYWWRYLSLTVIGVTLFFYPLIFIHYTSYQKWGIVKTIRIIKCISAGIVLASLLFVVFA